MDVTEEEMARNVAAQFQLEFANQVLRKLSLSAAKNIDDAWSKIEEHAEKNRIESDELNEMLDAELQELVEKKAKEDDVSEDYQIAEATSSQMAINVSSISSRGSGASWKRADMKI